MERDVGKMAQIRRTWLVAAGLLALGCGQTRLSHAPPDPLLVSKNPPETKASDAAPTSLARHEPRTPDDLGMAVASAGLIRVRPTVQALPASRSAPGHQPVAAEPASRPATSAE